MDIPELMRILEDIPEQLKLIRKELANLREELNRNHFLDETTKPKTKPKNRKNEVSEKNWREKTPIMLRLLLKGGTYKTVGATLLELENLLGVSPDVVHRIAKRLEEEGVLAVIKSRGGKPTRFRFHKNQDQKIQSLLLSLEGNQ